MIVRNEASLIKNLGEMIDTTEDFKKTIDSIIDEEGKETEEYKQLVANDSDIRETLSNISSEEDRKKIAKSGDIQSYIEELKGILDDEKSDDELKKRAERQIFLIRSSYTFEVFNEIKPTMKAKKLRENYMKLRRNAERKLDANPHFKFHTSQGIERQIKSILPDGLKQQSVVVASFIYAFIETASLKPEGYAMFVYFLIKNLHNIGNEFAEREVLIKNLIKLAEGLK